jgi:hypothetical protein
MKNLTILFFAILFLTVLGFLNRAQQVHGRTLTTPTLSGEIHFQLSSLNVAENDGIVEIVIERDNGSDGDIIVDASTFDGTAVAGQDYPATAETVTFTDGETEKTIAIPIIDNNTAEPDETFLVTLSIISGSATITEPSTVTITIVDNDTAPPAVLHFSSENYAVLENAGFISITVNRSGGSSDEVQVSYETFNGSATFGSDYMPALGTLTFPPGQTTQTFTVTLLDDPGAEGSETFTMALHNAVGVATLGQPANATVTILDDETAQFTYLPTIQR